MGHDFLSAAELDRRAGQLAALQNPCRLCPRRCEVDRRRGDAGLCGQDARPRVASVCAHHGEEPGISGSRGAGTVFVVGCPLGCSYCQNHQISRGIGDPAWETTVPGLAEAFLRLERDGCHNLEWVSPTQHLPALVAALAEARRRGLTLPLVFNSSGYERLAVLRLLDGAVDVYLPDAKYDDPELAARLSSAPDYPKQNRRALAEMWRQVGPLELDDRGLVRRGLVVRHLVLPGHLRNSEMVLRRLAREHGPELAVSLMAQYYPARRFAEPLRSEPLCRRITAREYHRAVDLLLELGLERGWVQERASHRTCRPDFRRKEPFSF